MRELLRRPFARDREQGEADPWLLIVSMAVSVIVLGGVVTALSQMQSWAKVYAIDAAQQHAEDGAAAAWTEDVGAASAIVPGGTIELPASFSAAQRTARTTANAALTAVTAVRFDKGTVGSTCTATAWWITKAAEVANGASGNLTDNDRTRIAGPDGTVGTADDIPYLQVNRQKATYTSTLADGRCDTSARPTTASGVFTPVRTADKNARIAYFNDQNRDLHFTGGIEQGVSASTATKPPFWTAAEWASAVPVQVQLVMSVDHEVTGKGVGVQAASQSKADPQALDGNPTAPFFQGKDTNPGGGSEDNPDRAPAPNDPPTVACVSSSGVSCKTGPAANDAAEGDTIQVTRTETRPFDGFELECREYDDEAATTPAGGRVMPRQSIAVSTPVTLTGTSAGKTYVCRQTGWVETSVGSTSASSDPNQPAPIPGTGVGSGKVYTQGPFGPDAAPVTRRAIAPALTINVPGDSATGGGTAVYADANTGPSTVTWPAVTGATSYEVTYQLNGSGAWSAPQVVPASPSPAWATPALNEDTRIDVRVQSVNIAGVSDLPGRAVVSAENRVDTPAPSMPNPADANQVASWAAKAGANGYDVQWAYNGAWQGAGHVGAGTLSTSRYVEQGDNVHFRVRGTGANTAAGNWAQIGPATRPVDPPTGVGISGQSAGSGSGAASATATGSCSGGTQVQFWWRDDRGNTGGWSTSGAAAANMLEDDTNTFYFAVRCANTTTGVVSGQVGTNSSPLYRSVAAPTGYGASFSNATSYSDYPDSSAHGSCSGGSTIQYGYEYNNSWAQGWGADNTATHTSVAQGGSALIEWFVRCVGHNGNVTGSYLAGSRTVTRPAPPPVPSVPSLSGMWTIYQGESVGSSVTVNAAANATSYEVMGRVCDSSGDCTTGAALAASAGSARSAVVPACTPASTGYASARASGVGGTSAWSGWTALTRQTAGFGCS